MRVLVTGWFSFLHGEATAGDLLALDAVRAALGAAGISHDTAWSPVFRPGGFRIEDAAPARYTHLVFVCGPLHGEPVAALHARYAAARRIAVGVSVIDRASPAHAGFDLVLARDGGPGPPHRDLAVAAPQFRAAGPARRSRRPAAGPPVPVTGVILATGQGEYGDRRRHDLVTAQLTHWLAGLRSAPLELDTRLDSRDWRLCSSAEAFTALVSRLDVVVTTRLHGLVLALGRGIPVLAVDPVAGAGKVTAQARAWEWPAIVPAEDAADPRLLDRLWNWCRSDPGRAAAASAAAAAQATGASQPALIAALLSDLRRTVPQPGPPGPLPC
jgi:hypothetical protein